MRIKSRWHQDGKPKSIQEIAGAMAFIAWRIAQNALKSMQQRDFAIDPGTQYFAFLGEFLVFLIQIADRIAYQRLSEPERAAFTTALAHRLGEILAENEADLLGGAGQTGYKSRFIALINERASDYATFACGEAGPDFGFVRYLGNRILEILPAQDHPWAVDQIMTLEAPDAVATVQKGMRDLLDVPKTR